LQAEIAKTNSSLLKAQDELDALKQDLAHEKMEKASAQADLEAVKSKKPDTSEADALRKELQTLKDQHQAALMTAQQESAKATEEHLATKASLEKAEAELSRQKQESESDYKDLHDSMTQLVEEANKKAADVEARLKEAEANLKVKDAELAEAKVCISLSPERPTAD
jgi:chromosome segregation ATPase